MNTSAVFESAGLSLRKVQQDYIEAAAGALTQDHKVALISAETGVGKTLGYLVPALLILLKNPEAKFVIATNSHALMHQIFRSDRPLLEQIADFFPAYGESKLRIPGESTWTVTHGRIYRSGYG